MPNADQLRAAHRYAAHLVIQHGDAALPLFERLEREMEALGRREALTARAREVAEGQKAQRAPPPHRHRITARAATAAGARARLASPPRPRPAPRRQLRRPPEPQQQPAGRCMPRAAICAAPHSSARPDMARRI